MDFTYDAYNDMCRIFKDNGYTICGYTDYTNYDKCVILRHDVDNSIEKALTFAQLEHDIGVKSTYFLLLATDLYNIASLKNRKIIRSIIDCGHKIGLHFDEKGYPNEENIPQLVEREIRIMSEIIGYPVKTVSMHRPSKETIESNYIFSNAVNTYAATFINDFKYISDSRHCWREPVLDIIRSGKYNRLHILTHPFWYTENGDGASKVIGDFVNSANFERYQHMSENIRDFSEFMNRQELIGDFNIMQ